jgi:signal transduction histidine kinase
VTEARTAAAVEELEDSSFRGALDRLGSLSQLRQSVLVGRGPADEVVSDYGAIIDRLLEVDAVLARQLDDRAVSRWATALHALVSAREQVARQHALILPALIVNEIDTATIDEVRATGVRLQAELEAFTSALTPDERARYGEAVTGAPEQARQRIVQLVVDRGVAEQPPATPPLDWVARSAAVIDPMLSSEQALRDQLGATAVTLRDAARATAGWNAVILLFALAFGVVVTFVIARSMQVPLRALRRAALDVADKQLPAAVAGVREGSTPLVVAPVPVRTSEEIGQVARAFDAVHFQAVRLAAEQAQLRANVDDMFVNLSRRSQGLVQRQLKLIDSLERSEEDPEVLDHLFQLDHLATRMRRNSENLLVLAGTESAKRSGPPVRLVDVVRAAVSEVEQYQRLVLQPPPGVLVLGRAAGDLVHLLAEVLDNATLFSPRDSQVTISSRALEDGSVVIEVNDRGVGMGEAELMEANERLATSPTVDASVSRRMGLFVVGRLASRHGIRVTVRRGLDSVGVTAAIALPPRLVRPIESVADGLPDSAPVPQVRKPAVDGRARRDVPAAAGVNGNSASVNSGDRAGGNGLDAESSEDRAPSPPPGAVSAPELPRRAPVRPVPDDPPPVAPRPPIPASAAIPNVTTPNVTTPNVTTPNVTTPNATAERSSGWDLFRSPVSPVPEPGSLGFDRVAQRAGVQETTPIFDDVASAWFRESKPVPVPWSQAEPGTTEPPTGSQTPEEREVASSVEPQAPVGTAAHDWGFADAGWQAAEALAHPAGGEVTPAGLPRRQPQAQLVPGAADSAAPAAPSATAEPVRSAEAVRGRLASYQRGVREGRQIRHDDGVDEQGQQHGADEETQ